MMPMPSITGKKDVLSAAAVVSGICMLGLFVRLLLTPLPGYEFDVGVNQGWAKSAVQLGLAKSYHEQVDGNMLPNYPPLSLMVFASTGHLFQTWISPEYDKGRIENRILIKLPSVIADLLTVVLLYVVATKWRGRKAGYLVALVYALHPAVIHDSAVWGQTDSLYTMFMVACLAALSWRKDAAAGALMALALLTKAQAIVIFPLVGFVLLLRGWRSVALASASFLVATVVVLLPFVPDEGLKGVWNMYAQSVGYYPTVSSNAYNFWWALLSDSAGGKPDGSYLFGIITYRNLGLLMFAAAYAWTIAHVWKHRSDLKGPAQNVPHLFFAGAVVAYAFFLFNTEMHERYLFPFVALATPLILLSRKAAWIYAGTTLLFFWNLLGVLPATAADRALYAEFPALDVFFACMLTFLFPAFCSLHAQLPRRAFHPGIISDLMRRLTSGAASWKGRIAARRVP